MKFSVKKDCVGAWELHLHNSTQKDSYSQKVAWIFSDGEPTIERWAEELNTKSTLYAIWEKNILGNGVGNEF